MLSITHDTTFYAFQMEERERGTLFSIGKWILVGRERGRKKELRKRLINNIYEVNKFQEINKISGQCEENGNIQLYLVQLS